MPDTATAPDAPSALALAVAVAQGYHQRSKHRLNGYAAGPDTLDWDSQPDPFRRYSGAALLPLALGADQLPTRWPALFEAGLVPPLRADAAAIGLLFELSLALSAWKQYGAERWALRVNPSSGNLHPTEAWLLCQGVPGLADGVHHYAPHEHGLELRAHFAAPAAAPTTHLAVALSSVQWREAWKYGERGFRYCQIDVGHAVAALRYAAAALGWCLKPVACSSAQLAALLGLDRADDFAQAEREEPELLFALCPHDAADAPCKLNDWPVPCAWHGRPNRLDRHPMYRWPVIDAVAQATRTNTVADAVAIAGANENATLPPLERPNHLAATLIRQRRSAQRFDARARLPLEQLWNLLRAVHPSRLPFDAGPPCAQVHLLLFAHRVDGLAPGAYLLPRSQAGAALLRASLPAEMALPPVARAPSDAPLLLLSDNPALAGTLRTLNCHQALGSDAMLGFALIAEFHPLPDAAAYRQRLQEAGLLGQALYLEAEAQGLRGTGIGCFFDDALHQLLSLPEAAAQAPLQSVYHFTIGAPLSDARIATEPPYAHRLPETQGNHHG